MNKVIVFLLITIFFSSFTTARYIADYDSRDLNQTIYNPTETIGKTATSYGANQIIVKTINNILPSYSNIDLVSDGNITIDGNSENSTIKIGLNADVNFSTINIIDLNGNDANFINIGAERFFGGSFYGIFIGDGSGLTGIPTDINSHFVPYIDAIADVNLGIYNLTANDLNSINLGVESNTHLLGNVYAPFIQTGMDGPTGFPNKCSDVIISFTDGTNTFSIQPSGASFSVFHSGIEFKKTAEETLVTTDDEGAHYIYYDETGTLQENVTPSNSELQDIIRDEAEVAILYWNTTADQNIYFTGTNECHGTKMDGATHAHQHFTRGTLFESGLAVGDITADDTGDNDLHAQISLTNGSIRDEDIIQTITDDSPQNLSIPANLPIFYRSGASNWRKIVATNFPITTTGTGRAAWNEFTGGAWQLSEVGNTDFVLSHIFATNNFYEPIVVLVGQADYATQTAAREGAATEVNNLITSGLGFQEFVPIATIIFQTNNGYSNAVKSRIRTTDTGDDYIDWRFTQLSPSVSPTDHGNLAGLADDDHDQYALSAGDTITGDLNINQDLNVGQDLNVIGNAQFRMDVNIWGDLNVAGTFDLQGVQFIEGGIIASGDSNFGNVGISQAFTTTAHIGSGNLDLGTNKIVNAQEIEGVNTVSITVDDTGVITFTDSAVTFFEAFQPSSDNSLDISLPTKRFKDLYLSGDANIGDDMLIQDDLNIGGDLNVQGNTFVEGDSNFGNLGIAGGAFIGGKTRMENDLNMSNNFISGVSILSLVNRGVGYAQINVPDETWWFSNGAPLIIYEADESLARYPHIQPIGDNTYDLGGIYHGDSTDKYWRDFFIKRAIIGQPKAQLGDVNATDLRVYGDANVSDDFNVGNDVNVAGSLKVVGKIFGDGSGLTGISADVNSTHISPTMIHLPDGSAGDKNGSINFGGTPASPDAAIYFENVGNDLVIECGDDDIIINSDNDVLIQSPTTIYADLTLDASDDIDVPDGYICAEDAGGGTCTATTDGVVYADDYVEHTHYWDTSVYGSALEEILKHNGSISNGITTIDYATFGEPTRFMGYKFTEEQQKKEEASGLSHYEFYETLLPTEKQETPPQYGISIGGRAAQNEAAIIELYEKIIEIEAENQALKEALCRGFPEDMLCK